MNSNSNGEVYGAKALNFAIIATSALILMGVLWQPAPVSAVSGKSAAPIEQVVVTAPRAHPVTG